MFIGSKIGENIQAITNEKDVSIQNIAYLTSKAKAIMHDTGKITQRDIRRIKRTV